MPHCRVKTPALFLCVKYFTRIELMALLITGFRNQRRVDNSNP
jgi:hypothetical protein